MRNQRRLFALIVPLVVTAMAASITLGTGANPADGVTGAPGEQTCAVCHSDHPLNSPGGMLSLTAQPSEYLPGETLSIQVHLARAGQARWGFEATIVGPGDTGVGHLLDTSVFTQYSTAFSKEYVKHVLAGTYSGTHDTSPGWGFRWVAPNTSAGTVRCYAAGNAANDDSTGSGDYIYSATLSISPRVVSCCTGTTGDIDCSGTVDISDLTALVDHLFQSFAPLCCPAASNTDAHDAVDIGDLAALIDHLMISLQPLAPCS